MSRVRATARCFSEIFALVGEVLSLAEGQVALCMGNAHWWYLRQHAGQPEHHDHRYTPLQTLSGASCVDLPHSYLCWSWFPGASDDPFLGWEPPMRCDHASHTLRAEPDPYVAALAFAL